MLIIRAHEHGGPEVLHPVQVSDPQPAADQVLVELVWSGVLSLDTLLRRGAVPPTFTVEFPWIPGQGGAGIVAAVGDEVDDDWLGRRVLVDDRGSYAGQMLTEVDRLVPVPDGLELDQAMALLHDGGTALGLLEVAIEESADPQVVAIMPAAGGAGSVLVQLARHRGDHVVAVVGGSQKGELVRSLGAEVVLDHHEDGWLDRLAAVQPSVIFDGVGGSDAAALPATVRPGGSYVNYGNAGGSFAGDLSTIAARAGIRAIGSEILGQLSAGRRERQLRILQLAAAGTVRAHIGGRFALADAAEAHQALADRHVAGKLLLDCGPGSI